MAKIRRTIKPPAWIRNVPVASIHADRTNPRKNDVVRMGLLKLSLKKLGFVLPVITTKSGMLLSGHQRMTTAQALGIKKVPRIEADLFVDQLRGANIILNRVTNDFTAFDTGGSVAQQLDLGTIVAEAEALPDFEGESWFALDCKMEPMAPLVEGQAHRYDKKATAAALLPYRRGIKIPAVVSASGEIVNGVHRVFCALEVGETHWPVVRIPDTHARVALNFLNYLSMDFHVDTDFERLLRTGAYRRPQNAKGGLGRPYRFWANGEHALSDDAAYSPDYWRKFRGLHGRSILDFGGGLCRAAPYLRTKGIDAIDFEPYRIDPASDSRMPSPTYSRDQAKRFLALIADPGLKFDSIFMAAVLNSIPFLRDRMCALAVVHALCTRSTAVYGTCRDKSDFEYEYGGARNANYFVFDCEPMTRLGDAMHNPKIQRFETADTARAMLSKFWRTVDLWPGGNIIFFRLKAPIGLNVEVLSRALELEFDLPFKDGSSMNLVGAAKAAFSSRLLTKV